MAPRPVLEYFFSIISSWSYVGSGRFRTLICNHNIDVVYKPIDIMHVFSVSGGLPVKQRTLQRQAYRLVELERWRQIRKIPINLEPKFYPADPSLAHRVLLAAIQNAGNNNSAIYDFVERAQQAVWIHEEDIADAGTVQKIATSVGLDGMALVDRARSDPKLSKQEDKLTREAVDRGIFGAPTFVYNGEPFWGQDRIEILEDVIVNGRKPISVPSVS